ncbi:MAG: helix-turn-helix domain-containing protein [Gemmatimonadota bacterium]
MTTRKRLPFGERLIASAEEAVQIERGELEPGRVTRYTAKTAEVGAPPQYDLDRIKGIRNKMEMSQALFAAALNVSPETIRAWEQGKRTPDGATLRLLELAEDHPEVFLEKVWTRDGQAVGDG